MSREPRTRRAGIDMDRIWIGKQTRRRRQAGRRPGKRVMGKEQQQTDRGGDGRWIGEEVIGQKRTREEEPPTPNKRLGAWDGKEVDTVYTMQKQMPPCVSYVPPAPGDIRG